MTCTGAPGASYCGTAMVTCTEGFRVPSGTAGVAGVAGVVGGAGEGGDTGGFDGAAVPAGVVPAAGSEDATVGFADPAEPSERSWISALPAGAPHPANTVIPAASSTDVGRIGMRGSSRRSGGPARASVHHDAGAAAIPDPPPHAP